MAYTAYRTWTTGEIVTAALMNEQVKDNGLLTAPAVMTTQGDILIASGANTPIRLAKSTTSTQYLANTGTSNAPAWNEVALATGVSGTLPVANGGTGITSLGSNVATFLGTPSSANLRSALTDETGTGVAVFATSPTLVTPALGTPGSGVLTSCTGLPVSGLANGTDGQLITWGTDAVATTVAVGTSTHVLTSNGAGAAPTFQSAAGGPSQANQAAIEAETNEDTYAPPDLIRHSPGVAKGYARLAGDGALQSGSYNVSSSSKVGTGYFQTVWDDDFADTLYATSLTVEQASNMGTINVRAITATHVDSQSFDNSGSTQDAAIQVISLGDQ
jgi:hypothetical protein